MGSKIEKTENSSRLSFIPHKDDEALFIARKLSKRFDQDISAVLMAAYLTKEGGIIASLRLAFGGMAEIPKRAMATEAYLQGRNIADVTSEGAHPSTCIGFHTPF